jgi:arginyl-tRNA synthetase
MLASLKSRVEALCEDAFESCGYDRRFGAVAVSDRPDIADFQCNGLLAVAKENRINPLEVAGRIMAKLDLSLFSSVSVARPGFLNFTVSDHVLIEVLRGVLASPRALLTKPARPLRVVLDYGGANLAKEMHVGHLRSAIVGQALNAIFRLAGHETISDVHLGDWGLQIGQLIAIIEDERPELLVPGSVGQLSMADLQDWYPRASACFKESVDFQHRAREATALLQSGKPEYLALWQRIRDVSTESLRRDYGWLGVSFDYWYGESRYQAKLNGLVARLVAKGYAEHCDGAVLIRLPEETKLPPVFIRNSSGAYGYGATDIATIEDRVAHNRPDMILYVVDMRQALHFRQVFAAAELCGILKSTVVEHVAFGTVTGADRKPFKTRAGGVMRLRDLIETMTGAARERLDEVATVPVENRDEVAGLVAAAAIKFGELSHDREKDYVFNVEQFLRFEGRTGPYLQYSVVRIRTLVTRAQAQQLEVGPISALGNGGRAVALALDDFPTQFQRAVDLRKPSFLANHVYRLAELANAYYEQNRVLGANVDPVEASTHLGLLQAALNQMQLVLDVLGIDIPLVM